MNLAEHNISCPDECTMTPRVLLLAVGDSPLISLEFLLTQSRVEGVVFRSQAEMENWLRYCTANKAPVVAVIVDSEFFTLHARGVIFSSILAVRRIPLIVVAVTEEKRNWCEISSVVRSGMPIYLAAQNLLPSLLERIKGEGEGEG